MCLNSYHFLWFMLFRIQWDLSVWKWVLFFHSGIFKLFLWLFFHFFFVLSFWIICWKICELHRYPSMETLFWNLFQVSIVLSFFSFPCTLHGEKFPRALLPDFQADILLSECYLNFQKCCHRLWLSFSQSRLFFRYSLNESV